MLLIKGHFFHHLCLGQSTISKNLPGQKSLGVNSRLDAQNWVVVLNNCMFSVTYNQGQM